MRRFKALLLLSAFGAASLAGCSKNTTVESSVSEEPVKVSPESITFDWQQPYEDQLKDFMASENYDPEPDTGSAFEIIDITGDGKPELIISPSADKQSSCSIYTCEAGSVTPLGEVGFFGEFDYLPELGLIHDEYGGDGFVLGKYMAYADGAFTEKLTYSDNSGEASDGATIVHEINGEEVLLGDYESALADYENTRIVRVGRKYLMADKTVQYAVRRAESWGAVLDGKQKELCRSKLTELMPDFGEESDPAFELCDLNGDDTPELIVSESSVPDAQCRIFYFSGSELAALDGKYGCQGEVKFDVDQLVFYSETPTEKTYWSLADSGFSAESYVSSGNIMTAGRKYALTDENITAAFA